MKSFDDLAKYNNTSAIHDGDTWMVKLHDTVIFKMVENKSGNVITLRSGGWRTVTTKKRINEAFRTVGVALNLFQEDGEWFVYNIASNIPFYDGMTFTGLGGAR